MKPRRSHIHCRNRCSLGLIPNAEISVIFFGEAAGRIAWDRYNTAMYQHFEGGYVEYDRLPMISDGILPLSGQTKNGALFRQERDLGLQIYYAPPPSTLTRGQLARTYCYDHGRQVASLREHLTGGYRWTTHEFTTTYDPCPSPYDVAADAPAPRSSAEAHRAWQQAYSASQSRQPQSITVSWLTAKEWNARDASFAVRADIETEFANPAHQLHGRVNSKCILAGTPFPRAPLRKFSCRICTHRAYGVVPGAVESMGFRNQDSRLFREHESLDYKTPGEVAKVSAPFTEWEDVVKTSSPDDRPRVRNLREARARLADAEMPALKERAGVKFIGFKERSQRPSRAPLVRTPSRKVSLPAGKGGGVKVAAVTDQPKASTSKAKVKTRQAHTYAKMRRAVQSSQRHGP